MRQVGMLVGAMPADTAIAVVDALVPNATCPDETATRSAGQAFKDRVHPHRRHWGGPACFGVATARAGTWPCPRSQRGLRGGCAYRALGLICGKGARRLD